MSLQVRRKDHMQWMRLESRFLPCQLHLEQPAILAPTKSMSLGIHLGLDGFIALFSLLGIGLPTS